MEGECYIYVTNIMEFGVKFKKIRLEKGMTQQDVADKLGIKRSAISKWESGNIFPNHKQLDKISEIFNVPVSYFLLEEGSIGQQIDMFIDQKGMSKQEREELIEKIKSFLKLIQ